MEQSVFLYAGAILASILVQIIIFHLLGNFFNYGRQSFSKAVKIVLVAILYNAVVSLTAWAVLFVLQPINQLIGMFAAAGSYIVLTVLVLWELVKYIAKQYDLMKFEAAVILLIAIVVTAVIDAGLYLAASLI
jgi:hypothetical protein